MTSFMPSMLKIGSRKYILDLSGSTDEAERIARHMAKEMLRVNAAQYILIVGIDSYEATFKFVSYKMDGEQYSQHKLDLFSSQIDEGSAQHRKALRVAMFRSALQNAMRHEGGA